jgi:hypothetical protein
MLTTKVTSVPDLHLPNKRCARRDGRRLVQDVGSISKTPTHSPTDIFHVLPILSFPLC